MYSPYDLKCEYIKEPIGIETDKPRFGWLLKDDSADQKQACYRIVVSDDENDIKSGYGKIWDSGKVKSSNSVNAEYGGAALKSATKYYWAVKWWDKDGNESDFSEASTFETGLMGSFGPAYWISDPLMKSTQTSADGLNQGKTFTINTGSLFRKKFSLIKKVKKARVYISGLGYYELYINGKKVGDRLLEPGWTDYKKTVLYSVYDITDLLNQKDNVFGVMLADSRYNENYGYDKPKLLFYAKIEYADDSGNNAGIGYADGISYEIVSDDTWMAYDSPVRENGVYFGETYDANMEITDWCMPSYNDGFWRKAAVIKEPGGKLVCEVMPPVRIDRSYPPVKITNPRKGVYIYDFGQNITGWVKLKVEGEKGTEVKMRYSELLYDDGTLNVRVNRLAQSTDRYTLKGRGVEEYNARFTYHGFRYVELTGFPGVPSLNTLTAYFIHTDVGKTGSFSCSDELLNNIHKNVILSQMANLMSIPTDCPQRDERMGWMGDAQLTAEEAIYNFDMEAFYTKYLDDIMDAQKEDGSLSDVIPPYWPIYPADPAWGTAYVTICMEVYKYYGDVRILKKHFDSMKKWVYFLKSQTNDLIVNYAHYGEWCAPGTVVPKNTPRELTSTFYFYHDTLMLSKIAAIIGRHDDEGELKSLAEDIKKAYNKKFLHEGYYGAGDQTSDVLGLQFDLVPEGLNEKIANHLASNLVNSDNHFDTGIIGTKYILGTLSEYGFKNNAYKMMTQVSYPSIGYMIKEGATTLWERWEKLTSGGMNSQNHIMFGTVDAWFYKYLAGINVVSPAWEKIVVRPIIPDGLKYAQSSVKTPRGYVDVSWEKKGMEAVFAKKDIGFEMEVGIPVNMLGDIYVPKFNFEELKIYDKNLKEMKLPFCIEKFAREEFFHVKAGSGKYVFKVK